MQKVIGKVAHYEAGLKDLEADRNDLLGLENLYLVAHLSYIVDLQDEFKVLETLPVQLSAATVAGLRLLESQNKKLRELLKSPQPWEITFTLVSAYLKLASTTAHVVLGEIAGN